MRRTYAKATAAELAAWKRRHGASVCEAAAWLGIGERTMTRFLSGRQRIPLTLVKLTSALD
jgi:hypothetical protein